MSEDQVPEVEVSIPEALGIIDVIYRTQYKGWEKMRGVLNAVLKADVTLTDTNALIAKSQASLAEVEIALAAKIAEAQGVLNKLSEQVRTAAADVRDTVGKEIAAQRAATAEAMELANQELSDLRFSVSNKQDELNAIQAKALAVESQVVELEIRGAAAEARMAAAKQALLDAQAHF